MAEKTATARPAGAPEGRPISLTPAGRKVLDAAAELFYREGIHAVGVDAVSAAAGVTKRTLYACFGSKERLVAAYLAERDERWRTWLTAWVDERATTPTERATATFEALGDWLEREGRRGCAFVNALAEIPAADHPGHRVVVEHKRWMLGYFTELASAAGSPDPAATGAVLLLLHEGVTVTAGTGVLSEAATHARNAASALFKA
ncbi:TetR/AcrR family transcriptional regulator [Nocardiopsis mangrovi]|uniref:TetR/AcrR family transcriptional regulator n=1 Tax=Nocardiopsis mangrovi TaxID=1179818 RepID=A0ABV9E614_9ACTN